MSDVFESKFGFHPCDYETYRKLKAIHKWYWQTLRAYANWERWNRKLPKNRVCRRWQRDTQGRKIGYEIVGPAPEPIVCPVLEAEAACTRSFPGGSKWVRDYHCARRPRKREEVVPLFHTIEQINQLYFRCRDWFEAKKAA